MERLNLRIMDIEEIVCFDVCLQCHHHACNFLKQIGCLDRYPSLDEHLRPNEIGMIVTKLCPFYVERSLTLTLSDTHMKVLSLHADQ